MSIPKRSLAEYFNAKGIDPTKLPIIKTFDNFLVLKGGVTMHKVGSPTAIPKCTSLPHIAKRVNRAVGKELFGYKNFFNLSHQNMNGCEILFEEFGDIYLLWIVPNPVTLATYLNEAMSTIGVWSYYNQGLIVSASAATPEKLTELQTDKAELEYMLRTLLTMIGEDFIYGVFKGRKVIRVEENRIYLQDETNPDVHVTLQIQTDLYVANAHMESTAYMKRILEEYECQS